MSSSALRTFALALIALALAFGVIAYFMNARVTGDAQPSASAPLPEESRVLAVVAVRTLAPYRAITREDVSLVPISIEPVQYYSDIAEVIGRSPVRTIATGVPVTEEAFGRRSALAEAIPPGTRAMSLAVSDVIAVGGFVQPGDFVDVLLYLRTSGAQVEQSQARLLIGNVRVLAYHERLINGDDAPAESSNGAGGRREPTAVVAIPQAQTTRVMLGASLGELRLALRAPVRAGESDADTPAAADTDVITLAELARVKEKRETSGETSSAGAGTSARATIEVYEGARSSRISRPY